MTDHPRAARHSTLNLPVKTLDRESTCSHVQYHGAVRPLLGHASRGIAGRRCSGIQVTRACCMRCAGGGPPYSTLLAPARDPGTSRASHGNLKGTTPASTGSTGTAGTCAIRNREAQQIQHKIFYAYNTIKNKSNFLILSTKNVTSNKTTVPEGRHGHLV